MKPTMKDNRMLAAVLHDTFQIPVRCPLAYSFIEVPPYEKITHRIVTVNI